MTIAVWNDLMWQLHFAFEISSEFFYLKIQVVLSNLQLLSWFKGWLYCYIKIFFKTLLKLQNGILTQQPIWWTQFLSWQNFVSTSSSNYYKMLLLLVLQILNIEVLKFKTIFSGFSEPTKEVRLNQCAAYIV